MALICVVFAVQIFAKIGGGRQEEEEIIIEVSAPHPVMLVCLQCRREEEGKDK